MPACGIDISEVAKYACQCTYVGQDHRNGGEDASSGKANVLNQNSDCDGPDACSSDALETSSGHHAGNIALEDKQYVRDCENANESHDDRSFVLSNRCQTFVGSGSIGTYFEALAKVPSGRRADNEPASIRRGEVSCEDADIGATLLCQLVGDDWGVETIDGRGDEQSW